MNPNLGESSKFSMSSISMPLGSFSIIRNVSKGLSFSMKPRFSLLLKLEKIFANLIKLNNPMYRANLT